MESNKFWKLITDGLELPFDEEDVRSVEGNSGTIYIELKNEDVYYITVGECAQDSLT